MANTDPNMGLNYGWAFRESGWKDGMDANLKKLGAVVQLSVLSKTTDVPASPSNGDRYIVPAGATGDWAGQDGNVAVRVADAWEYHTPAEGWRAWIVDIGRVEVYASDAWTWYPDLELGETDTTAYRGDRGKTAYDHSQTAHAPSDAQKNSDITKSEIEAKLTGYITTHWHSSEENYFVGIAYDTATDTFTRRGSAQGLAVGSFLGTFISPLFQNLRRVVLADDGSVYKGISWTDFTKHDDGTTVARDGDNGQIMMEYLPGYYRAGVIGSVYTLDLSHLPLPGFTLHPVFTGVDAVYLGAYEASVYNDGGTDKLCSIALDPSDGTSSVWPVTTRTGDWGHAGLTTAMGDTLAAARGTGWQQADFMTHNWLQLLMLVGFAGYNFQLMVGNGRTGLSGGDWTNDSYIGRCGLGDAAGGYHSAAQNGGTSGYLTDYSQVLGVENTYGNVWDRVASLVSDLAVYYQLQPPYDYSATTNWTRLTDALGNGITLPSANGYAGTPHSGVGLVLPADVTGSSSTKMTDSFYQAAGLRVLLVGGHAYSGAPAGPFCWNADNAASAAYAHIGTRLCYKKFST